MPVAGRMRPARRDLRQCTIVCQKLFEAVVLQADEGRKTQRPRPAGGIFRPWPFVARLNDTAFQIASQKSYEGASAAVGCARHNAGHDPCSEVREPPERLPL